MQIQMCVSQKHRLDDNERKEYPPPIVQRSTQRAMNRNNKSQPNATFLGDPEGGLPIMTKADLSIKYKTEFAT